MITIIPAVVIIVVTKLPLGDLVPPRVLLSLHIHLGDCVDPLQLRLERDPFTIDLETPFDTRTHTRAMNDRGFK